MGFHLNTFPLEASAILFGGLGLLSLARRGGNFLVTLLFALSTGALAAGQLTASAFVRAPEGFLAGGWAVAGLGLLVFTALAWIALSATLGRSTPPARLRRMWPFLFLWGLAGVLVIAARGAEGVLGLQAGGAGGTQRFILLGPTGRWFLCWLLVSLASVITNFEATLRTASGTALRRLRLMLVALISVMAFGVLLITQALLYHRIPTGHLVLVGWAVLAGSLVSAYSLLRHRANDVTVPAARPVVYSAVTTMMIGAYLVITALAAEIAGRLHHGEGDVTFPLLAVFGAAALAMVIFAPRLFVRVRGFVDRNLYAQRFDYRREWSRASRHLDPSHPLPELAASVAQLVRSVVGARSVQVLLRSGRDRLETVGRAGEETSSGSWRDAAGLSLPLDHPVSRALREHPALVLGGGRSDLDEIAMVVEGTRLWGSERPEVVVGLFVQRELVGALLVDRRESGEAYNTEEVDLLETMSAHLAHGLWSRRLADELVESRELASFHRLASFVLHDLKNILSGLSLTLRNAEKRWDDPEFRDMALRSMAASVEQMKELMGQVARARGPGELTLSRCDLNELLCESIRRAVGEGGDPGIRMVRRTSGLVEALVDRGQMASVFQNLIRNACEAMSGGGELLLETEMRPACAEDGAGRGAAREAVICVRDTGTGMDAEFVRERLFHPFASTKKRGFGLGLYQSRAVVEAHGGRLEVESVPGKGSEFRVILPVDPVRNGGA